MKKTALAALLATAMFSVATNAQASKAVGEWFLTPMISAIWVSDDRLVDDDFGGHIGIGKAVSERINIEFNVVGVSYEGFDEQDVFGVGFDVMPVFYRDDRFSPYFLLGVGYAKTNRTIRRDTSNATTSFGFGFLSTFGSSRTSLRTELRYRMDWTDENIVGAGPLNDFLINIGFQIPLGHK